MDIKKSVILMLMFLTANCVIAENNENLYAGKDLPTSKNTESSVLQQTTNWELLGKITAYSAESNFTWTGDLYVRIIGGKEFYKVRIVYNTSGDYKDCTVSFGNFRCRNMNFNAKFTLQTSIIDKATTLYFNI